MKWLIVFGALFSVAYCAQDIQCDELARIKIKNQWNRAYAGGQDREDFAQALWRAVFAIAPEARQLFTRVGGDDVTSPAFKAHAERVLAGLDIAINLLDQPEALEAELAHLAKQHDARLIPDTYFNVFQTALTTVLPAQLGRCYGPLTWKACFAVIAKGIRG